MAVYEKPSPISRFRYYQKILNVKLDTDQCLETLPENSASILSDLTRLSTANMTARDVMEEMVIMAISQLIPANHPLYSQLLSKSTITFHKFSEIILQHESAAKFRPGTSLQASATAFAGAPSFIKSSHEQVNDPFKCFFCGFKHSLLDCRNFLAAQKTYHENHEKFRAASRSSSPHPSRLVPKVKKGNALNVPKPKHVFFS